MSLGRPLPTRKLLAFTTLAVHFATTIAAAKQFDATAVRLAVIAHIRHKYTRYDRLLIRYEDRGLARQEVQPKIEEILDKRENPGS